MITQGLLMEDHRGQNFLLATERCTRTKTHRLVVLQRIDDKWEPVMMGQQSEAYLQSVISAVIDFVADMHSVLNSSGSEPRKVPKRNPRSRRSRIRASSQVNRWTMR